MYAARMTLFAKKTILLVMYAISVDFKSKDEAAPRMDFLVSLDGVAAYKEVWNRVNEDLLDCGKLTWQLSVWLLWNCVYGLWIV